MSQRLIARSADLKRLQDEGYDLRTKAAVAIVRDVPYLTEHGEITRGTLVSTLVLADDVTVNPVEEHVAFLAGEKPASAPGMAVADVQHSYGGVEVKFQLSAKPRT